MACKKSVINELNGFSTEIFAMEDIDFWLRACEKGFHSRAGIKELKIFHNNRRNLQSLLKQYFNYIRFFPWVLKKHFPKRFTITCRMKKILSIKFITGMIDFNPHTISITLILFKITWLPYIVFLLLLYRLCSMGVFLLKNSRFTLFRCAAYSLIMEMRATAMSLGAIAGSIAYKVFFIM